MSDRHYRCPVCGAPVEGEKCEYCGCVIYDFANISCDEPKYIRLKLNPPGMDHSFILQLKAIAVNPCIEVTENLITARDNYGNVTAAFTTRSCTVSLELQAVEDNGVLFKTIDTNRPYRESWRDDIEKM